MLKLRLPLLALRVITQTLPTCLQSCIPAIPAAAQPTVIPLHHSANSFGNLCEHKACKYTRGLARHRCRQMLQMHRTVIRLSFLSHFHLQSAEVLAWLHNSVCLQAVAFDTTISRFPLNFWPLISCLLEANRKLRTVPFQFVQKRAAFGGCFCIVGTLLSFSSAGWLLLHLAQSIY